MIPIYIYAQCDDQSHKKKPTKNVNSDASNTQRKAWLAV